MMTPTSKPQLVILIGLPGSGKSTRAAAWISEDPDARITVNYDAMRLARFGPNWHWNRKDEDEVKAAARTTAEAALKAGISVCIDNTNLSMHVRESWKQLGLSLGAEVIEEEMGTSVEECISRDRARGVRERGRVGRAVITRMALIYGFLNLSDGKREIVICDIDGTIADCQHRIHYVRPPWPTSTDCPVHIPNERGGCTSCGYKPKKDWAAFNREAINDSRIDRIISLVEMLSRRYTIILVSGRDTSIGIETEDWLDRHCITYNHLLLRQAGDHRPDVEHKLEILDFIPLERIAYVLEDRDRCVEAYRAKGLTVLQVVKGDY